MKSSKKKIDWFQIGGWILAIWAGLNTYLDFARYGYDQGFYWWFCNLALIGISGGLLFKHRGWLCGFLAIACFTQSFWLIDNTYRVFFHQNLFGLVEFMYQPGLPTEEFILSHYHYFTIPIAFTALCFLPQKKSNSLTLICIFNPLIFAVSYFAFPKVQNVNCIHEPCFPGLAAWAGISYSLGFWAFVFSLHLVIGVLLERFFIKTKFTPVRLQRIKYIFVVFLIACTALAIWDTSYKLSLPSFRCHNTQLNSSRSPESAVATCRFTLDYKPNEMLLVYLLEGPVEGPPKSQLEGPPESLAKKTVENPAPTYQSCATYMDYQGQKTPLHQGVVIMPNQKKRLEVVLPYPTKDVEVSLHANCTNIPSPENSPTNNTERTITREAP